MLDENAVVATPTGLTDEQAATLLPIAALTPRFAMREQELDESFVGQRSLRHSNANGRAVLGLKLLEVVDSPGL